MDVSDGERPLPRVVNPDGWPRPKGYANGMAASGEFLAVAGQIGWDATETLVSPDFLPQFRQALHNVVDVVTAAGGQPTDIISLTLFVTDKREYVDGGKAVGDIYRQAMGKHFPTMALIQISDLLLDGAKVEIQALAVLPPRP